MNIFETMEKYPTHESCIEFLEGIRFKDEAYCPHCGSVKVARKSEKRSEYKKSGLNTTGQTACRSLELS